MSFSFVAFFIDHIDHTRRVPRLPVALYTHGRFTISLVQSVWPSTMALLDFYQLAVVYNLCRHDAEFLSEHSYPPMPPEAPSRSTKSKPKFYTPFPLPFTVSKTPPPRCSTSTVMCTTPISHGSSIRQRQEGDTDRVGKYDCADYEDYIREDLGSRVFVDFEVFMKRVLHVPEDWKTKWRPAIDAVKADAKFNQHHKKYCDLCEKTGTLEEHFYPDLTATANAVLGVLSESNFEGIPSGERQYYHVNNPTHLKGGVMDKKGLSPDVIVLHKDRRMPSPEASTVHWTNPLHILEVKPYDSAVSDGTKIPRLVVGGKRARRCSRILQ